MNSESKINIVQLETLKNFHIMYASQDQNNNSDNNKQTYEVCKQWGTWCWVLNTDIN